MRKSKDRQHNGQKKKDKRTNNNLQIRVITKLPNSEQSYKGKVKTHNYINRQNQSTTGKLRKSQWPWLGTGISKEMVGWIRF
jgi:hypothetical protein